MTTFALFGLKLAVHFTSLRLKKGSKARSFTTSGGCVDDSTGGRFDYKDDTHDGPMKVISPLSRINYPGE